MILFGEGPCNRRCPDQNRGPHTVYHLLNQHRFRCYRASNFCFRSSRRAYGRMRVTELALHFSGEQAVVVHAPERAVAASRERPSRIIASRIWSANRCLPAGPEDDNALISHRGPANAYGGDHGRERDPAAPCMAALDVQTALRYLSRMRRPLPERNLPIAAARSGKALSLLSRMVDEVVVPLSSCPRVPIANVHWIARANSPGLCRHPA